MHDDMIQVTNHDGNNAGTAAEDGSNVSDLVQAKQSFREALDGRRNTWMYDWMIPLIESEGRAIVDFQSHTSRSIHTIRGMLHALQLKMVSDFSIFWTSIASISPSTHGLVFSQLGPFLVKL